MRTRSVALTVPAYVAADLIRRDCPDASLALKSLDYPPVAAVTLAYPMSSIRQDRLDEARKLPGSCSWALYSIVHDCQCGACCSYLVQNLVQRQRQRDVRFHSWL